MNNISPRNQSFSLQLPTLQIVVDQTSLGLFKECPRKYYYRMVLGYAPAGSNVHLQFGIFFHSACETYERVKAEGATHQEALRAAIRTALELSWDKVLGKPWNSENKDKNRYSLIRTLVWYLDDYGQNSRLKTLIFPSGKPAVELSFQFTPLDQEHGEPLTTITGEHIAFAGHLDSIILLEDSPYVSDRKTTSRRLNPEYFANYTPDNQFSMYALAGRMAYNIEVNGVICDAIQVGARSANFERQVIYRTEGQLWEWFADTKYYIQLMGVMAEQNRWPMNDKACFGCPYRPVCSRDPKARDTWLELDYVKSTWDPSIPR